MHIVTPGYFDIMGVRLVRGRWFADSDVSGSLPVAVINEAMAEAYWPNPGPLGVSVKPKFRFTDQDVGYTIVGIVREPKQFGSGETPLPAVYLAYSQVLPSSVSAIVRTAGEPQGLAAAMRNAALQIIPGHILVGQVQTGDELISESDARPRFTTQLLTTFSSLALLLAVVGIYTSRGTHEIGIRMALGAQRGDVMRLVLKEGMLLAGLGVAAGIVASYWFARSLTSFLYGVSTMDFPSFAAAAVLFFIVAMAACGIPARAAMRIEPIEALRYE
jgi:putative ABC transport system permease protein